MGRCSMSTREGVCACVCVQTWARAYVYLYVYMHTVHVCMLKFAHPSDLGLSRICVPTPAMTFMIGTSST